MDAIKKLNCKIYSTVSPESDEAAWLADRTKGIGGSDIGPICGVSPFTSARQIYLTKTGQFPDNQSPSTTAQERMKWGRLLEPVIADEYGRRTGDKLIVVDALLQHKDYPWALASVDRLIVDDNGDPVGILEVKTTSEYNNEAWDSGDILLAYVYQLNWYFFVTGLTKGAFACLVGGNKFYYYEVFRNDELINDVIFPAAQKFWEENVKQLKEPEMMAVDTDFVNTVYAEVVKNSEIMLEDDTAEELAATVVRCKAEIKNLEAIMEEAQNRIKDRMTNHEIAYTSGHVIKWSPRQQNRIDSDKVRTLYPEIVEKVTKPINYRAMTIKEAK